jgi:hypothetical protein
VQCCEWLQAHLDILPDIFITDEALFTHDGINNIWNYHTSAHENPYKVAERYFK